MSDNLGYVNFAKMVDNQDNQRVMRIRGNQRLVMSPSTQAKPQDVGQTTRRLWYDRLLLLALIRSDVQSGEDWQGDRVPPRMGTGKGEGQL